MTLSSTAVAEIRAAEAALVEALKDPDRTAWIDSYTHDTVFAAPGLRTLVGRSELLAAASPDPIFSVQIVADSTIGAGDFAATIGRASWTSDPRDTGAPTRLRRFIMVWRKENDGRWRIARELINEDLVS